MKSTRRYDLAELEQERDNAQSSIGRKEREAVLEAVYEQSKDPILEKARIQLIDAMRMNDIAKIREIQNKVLAYTHTNTFVSNLYNKMKRLSTTASERYIKNK